ncbi:GNAT family N-acetyltransferase [Myxococcus sp. RHSTA-1-4]|uniref:GNAT family N-acetyltransferase n=1 Tax=Myxococcus sp. RHSTA-1-4 TaxID=2874601 RepID=UPI001CBAA794|nr:GNAT family N-acetyltransferase [Myxococcus sp. RHSTA-1-4]MBZ4415202.1 GNAT family N-acetyltransferase [Myxococcus sp. RHSTA-1-4]
MAAEVGQREPPWVLRPARPEDHADFTRLFAELGVDDPPPPQALWAAELMPLTVFVEGPGGVVGYAATDPMGELGYVGQLVVDASVRRQGLGRWMMERLAERLRAQGCRRWALYVKRDNTAALGLYASVGLRPARPSVTLRVTRAQVAALPPGPPGLEVVRAEPGDWEALTEAFGMLPGKLARFATRRSHQLLRLARMGAAPDAPLGVMDLRAAAGLLFPFFAASPGHARALLEESFARVGDGVESLLLVVTGDEVLDGLLRGAGAEVCHETLELRGPLPEPRG